MGFAAVKEERCGLCVKASEEKTMLEERVKRAEAELREAKVELRETRMEVVALTEGWDDDGGGGRRRRGAKMRWLLFRLRARLRSRASAVRVGSGRRRWGLRRSLRKSKR